MGVIFFVYWIAVVFYWYQRLINFVSLLHSSSLLWRCVVFNVLRV